MRIACSPIDQVEIRIVGAVIHAGPPPCISDSVSGQVSDPGAPGAGSVFQRQITLPVMGSIASMKCETSAESPEVPDDQAILHSQWRDADVVAESHVGDLDVPDFFAISGIEANQMCIRCAEVEAILYTWQRRRWPTWSPCEGRL